jgi:hypothetical protein
MSFQAATSPEAFGAIVKNKELLDTIFQKMLVTRVGDVQQYHTVAVSDPKVALSGPVTEAYGTLFCFAAFD